MHEAGDCSGPASARAVLQNPRVEAAVFETARGGILRAGRGYDRCDEAGECDGRETAIAFAAPVALALAAIAVLRRRSSRHVEHREP